MYIFSRQLLSTDDMSGIAQLEESDETHWWYSYCFHFAYSFYTSHKFNCLKNFIGFGGFLMIQGRKN